MSALSRAADLLTALAAVSEGRLTGGRPCHVPLELPEPAPTLRATVVRVVGTGTGTDNILLLTVAGTYDGRDFLMRVSVKADLHHARSVDADVVPADVRSAICTAIRNASLDKDATQLGAHIGALRTLERIADLAEDLDGWADPPNAAALLAALGAHTAAALAPDWAGSLTDLVATADTLTAAGRP